MITGVDNVILHIKDLIRLKLNLIKKITSILERRLLWRELSKMVK